MHYTLLEWLPQIHNEWYYYLGLIKADGTVRVTNGYLQVALYTSDLKFAEKIAERYGFEINKGTTERWGKVYERYTLSTGKQSFCSDVAAVIGVGKTKSILETTDNVDHLWSYLHGFFDGDGSVSRNEGKSDYSSGVKLTICCNSQEKEEIKEIIDILGIEYFIVQEDKITKYCMGAQNSIENIFNKFYPRHVYMERKYDVMKHYKICARYNVLGPTKSEQLNQRIIEIWPKNLKERQQIAEEFGITEATVQHRKCKLNEKNSSYKAFRERRDIRLRGTECP